MQASMMRGDRATRAENMKANERARKGEGGSNACSGQQVNRQTSAARCRQGVVLTEASGASRP